MNIFHIIYIYLSVGHDFLFSLSKPDIEWKVLALDVHLASILWLSAVSSYSACGSKLFGEHPILALKKDRLESLNAPSVFVWRPIPA